MNIKELKAELDKIEDVKFRAYVKDVNKIYPIEDSFTVGTKDRGDIFLTIKEIGADENIIDVENLKKQINIWEGLYNENSPIKLRFSKIDDADSDYNFEEYDIIVRVDHNLDDKLERNLSFIVAKKEHIR